MILIFCKDQNCTEPPSNPYHIYQLQSQLSNSNTKKKKKNVRKVERCESNRFE